MLRILQLHPSRQNKIFQENQTEILKKVKIVKNACFIGKTLCSQ
jgi:hypothetical protein